MQLDPATSPNDSGYNRLEEQLAWYNHKSQKQKMLYFGAKALTIIISASIPLAAFAAKPAVTAALGAVVTICEATQHLCQWHTNWLAYRATSEALKREKYTFLGQAAKYSGIPADEAKKLLVERVEEIVSLEHSKWVATQEQARGGLKDNQVTKVPLKG